MLATLAVTVMSPGEGWEGVGVMGKMAVVFLVLLDMIVIKKINGYTFPGNVISVNDSMKQTSPSCYNAVQH